MQKYLALASGCVSSLVALLGWWTYTTDARFAEAVNTTVRLVLLFAGGCVLLVLLVRYGLPAFWHSADAWSRLQDARVERHVKLTRYAPSATGMYELPAAQVEGGAFLQAMQAATFHSQYEEPRFALQGTHAPAVLPGTPTAEAPQLPGPVDLADLHFTPTKDRILLGQLPGGELATANVQQLCHVALCGATGGGKSNLMRLIIPQLQAIGAQVVLADPHYTALDVESGDDWRAIERRLMLAPAVKADKIRDLFAYLLEELERRLERRNRQERIGAPLFVAFDELPVIVENVKDAADSLGKLLREGRKVHMLTVGASQDFLVKTIGSQSGVRDCYRTAVYVGGDVYSASALLDLPRREIDDSPLGGGVAMLRSATTKPAQLVRVPLASNAAIAELLGDDASTMPDFRATSFVASNDAPLTGREVANEVARKSGLLASECAKPVSPEAVRILALIRQGKGISEIVQSVYGVKGGAKFSTHAGDVMAIIAANLREGV